MKKLKLDIETLSVESFAATRDTVVPVMGTVRAHASERICPQYPDPGNGTGTIATGPFLCSSLPATSYC